MLNYIETIYRFNHYRDSLGIPPQAQLASVEKRLIELGKENEIEEVVPIGSGFELDESETYSSELEEAGTPTFSEQFAWVGEFVHGFLFWELALDSSGSLIRLRKSR